MIRPIDWFIENGCELTTNVSLFIGIYLAENRQPCTRCNCKDTCPAWPKMLLWSP